jgi:hypothetical protein
MQINSQYIQEYANERSIENAHFKNFLKNFSTREIDEHVAALNAEVSSQIDCKTCANCCKLLEPPVSDQEIRSLAGIREISTEEFIQRYTAREQKTGIQFLKCQPCIFLQENICGIYEHRPDSCADYPHLTTPHFKYRWKSIMTNYSLCPIVFNVVEKLKVVLRFTANE